MSTKLDDQLENASKKLNNMKFINNFLMGRKKSETNIFDTPPVKNEELPTLYKNKDQIENETVNLIQNHLVRRRNLDRPPPVKVVNQEDSEMDKKYQI